MKKLYFVILLIILQLQILQGGEIITHQEIAKRYLNADLVIIGEVISIKTETIHENKTIKKNGWTHIDRTIIDFYTVKIDSIIKGANKNSKIMIQSKPFSDNEYKEKFETINAIGDSLFTAVLGKFYGYRGGTDIINKIGNFIILIEVENNKNISTLSMKITEDNLNLLQKVKEKGIESILLKLPDNISK